MAKRIKRLEITPVISFDDSTMTQQVKFDSVDVGTILTDKKTKVQRFRSTAITIDSVHSIAGWSDNSEYNKLVIIHPLQHHKYNLNYKIRDTDMQSDVYYIADLIKRALDLENLPF